jgi:hypothetical protein
VKITYQAPTAESPTPKYFMFAQSNEEMRWMTILRDLLQGKPAARLRFVGAEVVGREVVGIPEHPVQSIALSVEDAVAVPADKDPRDPSRPIPPRQTLEQRKARVKAVRPAKGKGRIIELDQ